MKAIFLTFRNFRLVLYLALGLCLQNVVWSKPSIQSVEVTPNPLITGQSFTITVNASPDVTLATATIDFRPGASQSLQVTLVNQAQVWTGSGFVPPDLQFANPDQAETKVKVIVFDAAGHRAHAMVRVGVTVSSISAVFAGGVLTVTGDDQNNTFVVSRDTAGTILVNGGTLFLTGGVPTVANTTLIRILGLNGNDVLSIDDSNGPMPPANLVGGEGDDSLTGSANNDDLDGGPGMDTLAGRSGNDRLSGGPGNDTLIGGRGDDIIFAGEDDDQIVWNPGDGSDVVEGEGGQDTLVFNGSNVSENVDLSANGQRLRFFRDVGNVIIDANGVERVLFGALGGADIVTVNDLSGTQVTNVVVDLSGTPGTGDGQADTVVVNGTDANDQITVTGSAAVVDMVGLTASVTVLGGEPGLDELVINGQDGADTVDASAVQSGAIDLTLNGGPGDDVLLGGAGNDVLIGAQGSDVVFGGAGDDSFVWNPGDGSDTLEGQAGQDMLLFNGSNVAEMVDLSANGQRLRFFRNVGTVTMDSNGVELVQFNALGGADIITVNDLSGTGVTQVNLNLANPAGSGTGDNQADAVIVNGTTGDDAVTITGDPSELSLLGLAAAVKVVGSEPALDQLVVHLLSGDDVVNASGLQAGVVMLTADGGPGSDILLGSAGPDVLLGGDGDDVLIGGPGLDVLDGGSGSNILIQD